MKRVKISRYANEIHQYFWYGGDHWFGYSDSTLYVRL